MSARRVSRTAAAPSSPREGPREGPGDSTTRTTAPLERRGAHVVVVGAGGNIGSHLVPHLGRMPGLARVTLIDRDVYEPGNLAGQDIVPTDVGRAKAPAQARRLRRIAPHLDVESITRTIEDVPLGRLRATAIVAALDSRGARQVVNDAASHLGVPWIDTGVMAEAFLARVNVYLPGPEAPCLECAWDDRDYAALEVTYPCSGRHDAPATRAPSQLGALAASLAAIELAKLMSGEVTRVAAGQQVTVDAGQHRTIVTRLARRASCRRADHDAWDVVPLRGDPGDITLDRLGTSAARIAVEGRRIEQRVTCTACGATRWRLRARDTAAGTAGRCRSCDGALVVTGFDLVERLDLSTLGRSIAQRTLASLGVRAGDIVRVEHADGSCCRHEVADEVP